MGTNFIWCFLWLVLVVRHNAYLTRKTRLVKGTNSGHHNHHRARPHTHQRYQYNDLDRLLEAEEIEDLFHQLNAAKKNVDDYMYDNYYDNYFDEAPVANVEVENLLQSITPNGIQCKKIGGFVTRGVGHPHLPLVGTYAHRAGLAHVPNAAKDIFIVTNDPHFKIQIKYPTSKTNDILGAPQDLEWEIYKEKFNKGWFNGRHSGIPHQIVKFRNEALEKLLAANNANGDIRRCFDDIGSSKLTSDLDFTLVRWDRPQNVVQYMTNFYKSAEKLLGNYPNKAFDMNFYIATCIISVKPNSPTAPVIHNNRNCLGQVHANVQRLLLNQVDDHVNLGYALWEVAGTFINGKYKIFDRFLQLYLIHKRAELSNPQAPPNALKTLVKLSATFYQLIGRLQALGLPGHATISDDFKMYCHAILLWMNYFSDESYITNIALIDIWMQQKGEPSAYGVADVANVFGPGNPGGAHRPTYDNLPINIKDRFLMALDQFAFVKGYQKETEGLSMPRKYALTTKTREVGKLWKLCYFLDRASKYWMRVDKYLDPGQGGPSGGEGGVPNWKSFGLTVEGIPIDARKTFTKLATEGIWWNDHIRGTIAISTVLARWKTQQQSGHTKPVHPDDAYLGAELVHKIYDTWKYDTPAKIWDQAIKPLWVAMSNSIKQKVKGSSKRGGDQQTLEQGMEHILSNIGTQIKLRRGIEVNAAATDFSKIQEDDTNANPWLKATNDAKWQ
eukprot:255617_1